MLRRRQQFVPAATSFEGFFQVTRKVHWIFAVSPLIYVLVALVLKRWVLQPQGGFVDFAVAEYNLALLGAGLASIGMCFALYFLLPRWQSVAKLIKQSTSLLDLGAQLYRVHLQRVQIAMIPAILGLVLFLLNGILEHLVVFSLITLLLLVVMRPRWSVWQQAETAFETP